MHGALKNDRYQTKHITSTNGVLDDLVQRPSTGMENAIANPGTNVSTVENLASNSSAGAIPNQSIALDLHPLSIQLQNCNAQAHSLPVQDTVSPNNQQPSQQPTTSDSDEENVDLLPVLDFVRDNVSEISMILLNEASSNNRIIQIDDDCQMVFDDTNFPQPLTSTLDGLIKHESDSISLDKPFYETVWYCSNASNYLLLLSDC